MSISSIEIAAVLCRDLRVKSMWDWMAFGSRCQPSWGGSRGASAEVKMHRASSLFNLRILNGSDVFFGFYRFTNGPRRSMTRSTPFVARPARALLRSTMPPVWRSS